VNDPNSGHQRRAGLVLSHLAVAALAAGVAVGVTLGFQTLGPRQPAATPPPAAQSGGNAASANLQRIVHKVAPGLVIVNTALQYDGEAGAGTGMVISRDGLVLTNNHVIEAATRITVTVVATGTTYPATVVGYDKTGDIALLRLPGAARLKTVPLGDSAAVKRGDRVVALGNADGQGAITPAVGRVTALNRTITAADQSGTASSETLHGMIQTDAQIVSGDSGGSLVNTAGQVIGMNTAGNTVALTQDQPIGLAIPIDTALSVAREIASGRASSAVTIGYPPFLGIFMGSGTSADPQVQAQQQSIRNGPADSLAGPDGFNGAGAPDATPSCYTDNTGVGAPASIAPVSSGTLVDGTICGSPAASAGLTAGSVITAVNGQPAGAPPHMSKILSRFHPGDRIAITWVSPTGKHAISGLRVTAGPPQ
jgi:S1-C subfamily serine protease